MQKNELITSKTYVQIIGPSLLPDVKDAHSFTLEREVNLMRSVLASGLSAKDDRLVAGCLLSIASMLSKQDRLARIKLLPKAECRRLKNLLLAILQAELPSMDLKELERTLDATVENEVNLATDID